MSRKKFWAYLKNEQGQPIPSASITFKLDDTGALAKLYSTSVSAANDSIDQSTLTTDVSGFFEFFVGDVYEQGTNRVGYDPDQTFRLEWESPDGRKSGYIDQMQLFYQVFPVDETDSRNTLKNKLASNDLTYGWSTHRQQTWFHEIHGITQVDETDSTDATYSHLVSNNFMNEVKLDLENLQASGGESLTIESSAAIARGFDIPSGSWIPASGSDAGLYCYSVNHQFNTRFPLIQLWCTEESCMQVPVKIKFGSLDELTIYITPEERDNKHAIIISESNIGNTLIQQNPTFEADLQTLNMTQYGITTNLIYNVSASTGLLTLNTTPLSMTPLADKIFTPSASQLLTITQYTATTSGGTVPLQEGAFVFDIQTTTEDENFGLPLLDDTTYPSTEYDMYVDWGDNSELTYISNDEMLTTSHTYASSGTHTISISGTMKGFAFTDAGSTAQEASKVLEIRQWGDSSKRFGTVDTTSSNSGAFYGCSNMTITATDTLNVSADTSMYNFFRGCSSITNIPNIGTWDVSNVTYFNNMFFGCTNFNSNINNWDVSSGYQFIDAFNGCSTFNSPLSGWSDKLIGSSFIDMESIFEGCSSFEGFGVENWDVTNLVDAKYMFNGCTNFNRPIGNWGTSFTPSYISYILQGCSTFNQPLSGWSAMAPTLMPGVFYGCTSFDQNINNWDLSNIGGGIAGLVYMFFNCINFNQPLNNWDVSGCNTFNGMFYGCTLFNQDLSSWNTSNGQYFSQMFYNATNFNQSLATFNMTTATNCSDMLDNCGIDTTNYDALLEGWDGQSLNSGVTLGAEGLTYTDTSSRNAIITQGWTINGDSEAI